MTHGNNDYKLEVLYLIKNTNKITINRNYKPDLIDLIWGKKMQSEHHDLVHEFPEFREKIHDLKMSDEHFKKLFDEYHKLDREVYRVEYDIEPRSDTALEDLKKRRLALKDELYHILKYGVPKPGTVET